MDIAILGAGNVGAALAASLTKAGHTVTLTATTPEKAQRVAGETGARAAGTNREAAQGADVVILAVPAPALDDVAAELDGAVDGKVVIDTTNRVNMEDPAANVDGSSISERLQQRLAGARVVKSLNTVFSSRMADPDLGGTPSDLPVAADDEDAKRTVFELARDVGFRPLDAGPLASARTLEAMAALLIWITARQGWGWGDGWKIVGPTASSA